MKTLFLHIGMPKTATTSIQKFCAINREMMEKNGYCYPEDVRTYPGIGRNRNAHFMIHVNKGTAEAASEENLFQLGMEQVHDCFQTFDNVVLSDESIWKVSVGSRLWSDLKADASEHGYVIKIIAYLRRQDEFLSSRYNQRIKHSGYVRTWEEQLKDAPKALADVLDYGSKIQGIAEIFGKENLYVRRFNRNTFYGGSIYTDFFQCLGLELTDNYQELEADVNVALKGNTFEIVRIINTMSGLDARNKSYLQKIIADCSEESGRHYQYGMFSREEAEEFVNNYRRGNEQIAEEFIGDGQPLFDYEAKDIPKWEKQNEYMIDDLVRIFSSAVCGLHEDIVRLEKENSGIKAKIARYEVGFFQKLKRRIRSLFHSA